MRTHMLLSYILHTTGSFHHDSYPGMITDESWAAIAEHAVLKVS